MKLHWNKATVKKANEVILISIAAAFTASAIAAQGCMSGKEILPDGLYKNVCWYAKMDAR